MIVKAEFEASKQKFEDTEWVWFDVDQLTLGKNSKCLKISELKNESFGKINAKNSSKYFLISGKVTNECISNKDFVKVNYILYNKEGEILLDDWRYVDPRTVEVGKSSEFEVIIGYEGENKQIAEAPYRYEIKAET